MAKIARAGGDAAMHAICLWIFVQMPFTSGRDQQSGR
jgi:hypothetical protein